MNRRGVICGGSWLVDHNKLISHWPNQETMAKVTACEIEGGGAAHNMALDLVHLDPEFPVWAMGVVGNDAGGRFLRDACTKHGIDVSALHVLDDAATAQTDVMTVIGTGKRTFFYHQAANARLSPEHFDFEETKARILHLGVPGAHDTMDATYGGNASGWITVLKRARAAGLRTNLEMVSGPTEMIRHLALPCLPFLDTLIINDHEAGILTGIDVVSSGITSVDGVRKAAVEVLRHGPIELVAIHFPGGCIAATRDGEILSRSSLAVPPAAIAGANGAGDAFAAGLLYAIHEGWALNRGLDLACCAAASALRSVSTTSAVGSVAECLSLADTWGWRTQI